MSLGPGGGMTSGLGSGSPGGASGGGISCGAGGRITSGSGMGTGSFGLGVGIFSSLSYGNATERAFVPAAWLQRGGVSNSAKERGADLPSESRSNEALAM
jgi:hypothetical protein